MQKLLYIRLQKEKDNKNTYNIIITRGSSAKARLDSLGKISKLGGNYTLVKINTNKFRKYSYKGGIKITPAFVTPYATLIIIFFVILILICFSSFFSNKPKTTFSLPILVNIKEKTRERIGYLNYIQKRKMRCTAATFSKLMAHKNAGSHMEKNTIKPLKSLVNLDAIKIHNSSPLEQEIQFATFLISELITPNTEIIQTQDSLMTIFKTTKFKKESVMAAFDRLGYKINPHLIILGIENNCSYQFISEVITANRVMEQIPIIKKIILMNENAAPSIYSHHTRQYKCDVEVWYYYENILIKRGFDIKFGNIHDYCASTINPILYDPILDKSPGIFNNTENSDFFQIKRIKYFQSLLESPSSSIPRNLIVKSMENLQSNTQFSEKIQKNNTLELEINGECTINNIKGFFFPKILVTSEAFFHETEIKTLHKHPNMFKNYNSRQYFIKDLIYDYNLSYIFKEIDKFKGTPFECRVSAFINIEDIINTGQ